MHRRDCLDRTILDDDATCGMGELHITHPTGTFAITPASRVAIRAIGANRQLLSGTGIDWGSGTGCMAIAAARLSSVERIIGLELSPADVEIARRNAAQNGVGDKLQFIHADSYTPFAASDRENLHSLRGRIDFVLANPPASDDDDGFGFRRVILRGAGEYLLPGGRIFLNISYQYGEQRTRQLCRDAPGFSYLEPIASTDWVPFDLRCRDLLDCLELYAREEERGGLPYAFAHPEDPDGDSINAGAALQYFHQTGRSPLSKWQTHLFEWRGLQP
ncbi:MAG: methyltransferase [Gemmatimonadetes bacterium]|nr:methyltransferase [Gemmatimonadota bacterium]